MAIWGEEIKAPMRRLQLGGRIVFGSGREVVLNGDMVSALTIEEGASGTLEPGCVLSAGCTLDLVNEAGQWNVGGSLLGQAELMSVTLMPELGIVLEEETLWQSLGVFQVEKAAYIESEAKLRLQAKDSVAYEMAEVFQDGMQYPCSLQTLWEHAVEQSAYVWHGTAPNGEGVIDTAPDWKEVSLRTAIGYIAAAAGSYVRIDREGALEICPLWKADAQVYALDEENYLKLESGGGVYGPVDALKLKCSGADAEKKYYATDGSGLFAVSISENPLYSAEGAHTDDLAQGTLAQIAGFQSESMNFEWRGDPALRIGDRIRLRDRAGNMHEGVLTRQTLRFSSGFSASCVCEIPQENNSGVRRAITPEGGLNSAALVGAVNGALLSVGSVTTSKLAAGSITAEKIATGALDAIAIDAVAAKIGKLTAKDITTDNLAAAFAAFTVITAGTASFDQATIKHLVAEAMNLEFGTAGQVFIKNLAVEYAQMVGAAIGNLCIKASDGNYYRMDVDADGNVTATLTTVTEGEISAGQTGDGQIILETNITASNLSTGNLLATYALINRIDAARISVDELFAREAFISLLRTSRIVDDKSIEMIVGDVEQNAEDIIASRSFSGDTPPTGDLPEGKIWVDTSENPSVIRRWLGLDVTTDAEYSGSGSGKAVETPNGTTAFDQIQQNLTANQNGSGDPSPDNIRWINPGRAKAILTRAGENLIGFDNGTKVSNGVSCVFSDHKISASGACTESWVDLTDHAKVGIQKNKAYTVTFDKAIGYTAVLRLAASSTAELNGYQDVYIYAGDTHVSFTADADYSYARIYIGTITGAEISISDLNVCLTAGSEARNVAYSGESFTLGFGQTVASGTLEWTTGKLIIDKKMLQLDGVANKVILSSTISKGNIFRVDIPGIKHAESASAVGEVACSHYIATTGNKLYSGTQGVSVSAVSDFIQIFDTARSGMTADEYNSYLAAQYAAGTPVQILYALAEPEEVQLSVLDIRPISGEVNTLSVADGTLTVNYTASGWETVSSLEELNNGLNEALRIANAAVSQEEFQRIVRTDAEGLHVGDNLTDYEVLIDSASVNVVASGKKVSSFSTNFIRLDNMQIRKVRGGLAISVYNG